MSDVDDDPAVRRFLIERSNVAPSPDTANVIRQRVAKAPQAWSRSSRAVALAGFAAACLVLALALPRLATGPSPDGSSGPRAAAGSASPLTPQPSATPTLESSAVPPGLWVTADPAAFGGPGDQVIVDVASYHDTFVALGADQDAPAIWFSSDGLNWSVAQRPSVDGQLSAIAASDTLLVAVGHVEVDGTNLPIVWTSTTGRSWTSVDLDPAAFPAGSTPIDVTFAEGAFHMVGGVIPEPSSLDGATPEVWRSVDATNWKPLMRDETRSRSGVLNSIGVSGRTLVAAGTTGGDPQADALAWASTGGEVWTELENPEFDGPGAQSVGTVVGFDEGLYLVGRNREAACVTSGTCARTSILVWTSPDGQEWARNDVGPSLTVWPVGSDRERLLGMRPSDDEETSTPVRSRNGLDWEPIGPELRLNAGEVVGDLVTKGQTLMLTGGASLPGGDDGRVWLVRTE